MMAYLEGMSFRRRASSWSIDEKRSWILSRLRFSVRRAERETSYYRDLFRRVGFDSHSDFGFEEFSRLPILSREEIRTAGRSLVSSRLSPDQLQKDSTGGSTGTPTEIWIGPEERGWRESAIENSMRNVGVQSGDRTAFFWGHHLDPIKSHTLRDRWYFFATNVRWFDCFRLSREQLEAYHLQFTLLQPACIVAYASALGQLAEMLLERGIKPSYPSTCLITGAEKLLPEYREAIERVFKAPVYERYGSRDVGSIGMQNPSTGSLGCQLDWANLLIEPETTDPDSPVLITKLHGDGMPMIRYRIGDIGLFPAYSRPGFPAFELHEVIGRETDRIWLPNGRWIHGIQMPHLMKDYPVKEFMLVQRDDYSVELRIVPKANFGQESCSGILKTVSANLPGVSLSVNLVDEIPRTVANKRRPVMSAVAR